VPTEWFRGAERGNNYEDDQSRSFRPTIILPLTIILSHEHNIMLCMLILSVFRNKLILRVSHLKVGGGERVLFLDIN